MRLTAAFCLLIASAIPAAAVPATPEGAARIEAAYRKVLGPLPGVVTVRPEGETYAVTVDLAPLVALIPVPELEVTVTPYTVELTDNGDGTWVYREEGDFALTASMAGTGEMNLKIEGIRGEGIFDERLVALTSYRGETGKMTMSQEFRGPDGVLLSEDRRTVGRMVTEITAQAATEGGIDAEMQVEYLDNDQTVSYGFMSDTSNPLRLTIAAERQTATHRLLGIRSAELLDLIGFFVAHPANNRIIADQEVLRSVLTAALPLFGRVEAEMALEQIVVGTPMGPVTADLAGLTIGFNGVVAEGRASERIFVKNLSVPQGPMPAWVHRLLPSGVDVGAEIAGFDLAAPAKLIVENFDLTKPEPIAPEMQFGLLGALLPTGMVEIRITPSSLGSDLYGIEASGQFTAGMMVPPSGKMQVTATGLDAVEATLDPAADDPDAAGLRGALGIARALATPGANGALAWEIEFTEAQRVLVNGTDITGAP